LAYDSDLELAQIARLETGRNNATICTLKVIAKTLKIPPKDLLDF
jgi:transcriptional regulator with XRE-family HTH domain